MIQLLRKCLYIFQLKVIPKNVKNLVLCGYWNHITFPSNFVKDSTYNPRVSKLSTSTPKSPTKTSSKKCFKRLGFGHIATNCPSKRTMMIKVGVVMSGHSSQRSKSPTSSKSQIEEEYELPCEGDLLVIRRMLGQIQKPFAEIQRENIFSDKVPYLTNCVP